MRFSMILEMVDKFTVPAKRAKAGVGGLTGAVNEMKAGMRKARSEVLSGARSVEHFERRARRIRQVALGRTLQDIAGEARRLGRNLDAMVAKLRLVERAGMAVGRSLRSVFDRLVGLAKYAGAAGLAAVGYSLFDMFRDAGNVERAKSDLAAFVGSVKEASEEIENVKELDLSVPIGQLIQGYTTLRTSGVKPTTENLRTIADEARRSKKEFIEVADLLKEARAGDYGGLEALGISAEEKKGVATLTFLDKEGKRVSRSFKDSADAIQAALLDIFEARSGGASARYRTTFFGLIDGMRDRWSRFQLMVADAGIFDKVRSTLDGWMNKLDALAKNGDLAAWAKKISDGLSEAWDWGVKFVEDTDWKAVGEGLAAGVRALTDMVILFGQTAKMVNDINNGRSATLRRTKEPITLPSLKSLFNDDWFKVRRTTASNDTLAPSRLPASAAALTSGGNSGVKVSGNTVVEIRTAPGLSATTRSLASNNAAVPMEVRTGKTMRSAA